MKKYDCIPPLLPIKNVLAPELKRWLVIDGALLPELEKQIYLFANRGSIPVVLCPLFRGTRWENMLEVGPYLVQHFPQLEEWLQQASPYHYGIMFDSSAPLSELEAHWGKLINCEHPGLEGYLNRLYDAVVIRYLLQNTDDIRRNQWLGPMQTLWLPDLVQDNYYQVCALESIKTAPLEKSQFTDEEWQSLSDSARYYTAYRLISHIENFFPSTLKSTKVETHDFIMACFNELKLLGGEVTEQLGIYYLNIVSRLGARNEFPTKYPEIEACLVDKRIPLLERLKQANADALAISINREKS